MSAAAGAVRLVLVGASGRMGRQVLRELPRVQSLRLTGALVSSHSAYLGRDAGELAGAVSLSVPLSAQLEPLLAEADLVIDFSLATAVPATLAACTAARVPLLIGATGLPVTLEPALAQAARVLPLLVAPNTSLAVNVLLELVRRAAGELPAGYDIEIIETHHRHKRDAPSGTALALGEAAAAARGVVLADQACYAREGEVGERPAGQIGFAVVRGGDVVGEHQVRLLGEGESLELAHRATDRAVFARGALAAGRWLAGQPPGRYAMRHFLASAAAQGKEA